MKKDFRLLEHNLIPLALFAANMCVVHFIYLLFIHDMAVTHTLLVAMCIVSLTAGIIKKNKWVIIAALGSYTLVILGALINPWA